MSWAIERVGVVGAGTDGRRDRPARLPGRVRDLPPRPGPRGARAPARRGCATASRRAPSAGGGASAEAEAARARLSARRALEDLAGCELVIEAAPEDLELKRELFAGSPSVCGPEAILATNTSSLSVTAIAAGVERPERVVRHALLQPAGADAAGRGRRRRRHLAETLSTPPPRSRGRWAATPVRAADAIGFVANRSRRPSRSRRCGCSASGSPTHDQIDRICRLGGGFRMGPFELMDLVGRRRQLRGREVVLGAELPRAALAAAPDPGADGRARAGSGERPGAATTTTRDGPTAAEDPPLRRHAERDRGTRTRCGRRRGLASSADRRALGVGPTIPDGEPARQRSRAVVGFVALPDLETRPARRADARARDTRRRSARRRRGATSRALGKHVEWVGDRPGLVLGRIVCQLVNEAALRASARASRRAADSTRRCGWASTGPAGRSSGARRSASTVRRDPRRAPRRAGRGALPGGAAAPRA